MRRVGFTGSRHGLSLAQRQQLVYALEWIGQGDGVRGEFHHGDGADANGGDESADRQAAKLAYQKGWEVHAHPPAARTAEAMLARNRVVVGSCSLLIAAPETDKEVLRSGTWATVRYARHAELPVLLLARGKE